MAAVFGSVIGFERERLLWAAGIRTHMVVCVGACLIMIVSAFGFGDSLTSKNVGLDPSRVAAQVVPSTTRCQRLGPEVVCNTR
jgi:putative Mg2+ transporter-C (MgtC) family protein